MNLDALNATVRKVIVYAQTELPASLALLTTDSGLPISPILGQDEKPLYWVVYLEKYGSGDRPKLTSQEMNDDGVAELGRGWRVGRLKIAPDKITWSDFVVNELKQLASKMSERDRSTEN